MIVFIFLCSISFQFVAEYAQKNLFSSVLSSNVSDNNLHGEILTKHILEVDDKILKEVKGSSDISGLCLDLDEPVDNHLRRYIKIYRQK